jgi:hypothetical protein
MMIWHIEASNDPRLKDLLFDWYLDTPQNGAPYDARLHLVLRLSGLTLSYPMNQDRADVVEVILHEKGLDHPRQKCGFHRTLQPSEIGQGFTIGFETDGSIIEAVRLTLQTSNSVS